MTSDPKHKYRHIPYTLEKFRKVWKYILKELLWKLQPFIFDNTASKLTIDLSLAEYTVSFIKRCYF